jgi:mono/diheme cytochrome c family protein
MKTPVRRLVRITLVALAWIVGLFGLMQLVPYGRTHGNPPVTQEPAWDSPHTRALAVRACFNCHSNETRWPWYANLAPFSWVVQFDVEAARSVINFSEWNRAFELAPYSGQSIRTGNMPTLKYQMAHPEADLTRQETLDLARGLDATLGTPREPRS